MTISNRTTALALIGMAILALAAASLTAGDLAGSISDNRPQEIIVCGWDEVFILSLVPGTSLQPSKVWSWKAKDRPELPPHMRIRFGTTDDCKPVDGGRSILVTSSGGGVALVDRETGKVTFWAVAGNAHSADVLPGNRVAVALSYVEDDLGGNRLEVYDIRAPEKVVYSCELTGGHGVVWDEERRTLWALSGNDIRAYQLDRWETDKPSLKLLATYDLPEGGGHDLFAVPNSPALSVTTGRHCWLFDRDKHSFKLHPLLSEVPDVKSICVNPNTSQLAYVQGGQDAWWSDTIHLLGPNRVIRIPGEHLYKARWNTAPE